MGLRADARSVAVQPGRGRRGRAPRISRLDRIGLDALRDARAAGHRQLGGRQGADARSIEETRS
ncbi:hypothetical protein BVI2075_360023 [Burkholderia vietnamiensis]|nr:hypothetical protein BVI2075_360023 [Burkholderia vietnamiensis]